MTTAKPTARVASGPPMSAVLGHGDLGFSLLMIFPLFLIYEVGVAFSPVMNGVDFFSKNLMAVVGYSKTNYLLLHAGLAVLFVGFIWLARRGKTGDKRDKTPNIGFVLLESTIYALTLGTLIIFVMRRLLHIDPDLAAGGLSNMLMSIGAGVHEELVFRLGACAGGAALLRLTGLKHGVAVAAAFLVSSALFSAVHHVGSMGEPFTIHAFIYRTLAGLLFATIFYYRSLAHATYTHALYDVYVLVLR